MKGSTPSSLIHSVGTAVLDFDQFELIRPINEVGTRLTVLCRKKRTEEYFFVKETYSDEWSKSEVMTSTLLALTGMRYPDNALIVNTDQHPFFKAHHEKLLQKDREEGINSSARVFPRLAVASAAIENYQDVEKYIEKFLNNQKVGRNIVYADSRSIVRKDTDTSLEETLRDATEKEQGAAAVKAAFKGLSSGFKQLPVEEQNSLLQLIPAAQWVGDWDFWNIKGENAGYALEKGFSDHRPQKRVPAAIDFGNSLKAGLKGNEKGKSFGFVNEIAKPEEPPIPKRLKVQKWAASFDSDGAMRLLSTIPRRYTIDAFFPGLEEAIVMNITDFGNKAQLPDDYLKGIYRLSLIPEEAIRQLLSPRALAKKGIEYKEEYQDLADILVARCHLLTDRSGSVGQAVRSWVRQHPTQALQVQGEVNNAVKRLTGIEGRGVSI